MSLIFVFTDLLVRAEKGVTVKEVGKKGVDIWTNKGCGTTYSLGETLEIHVKSKKSGYLTVFDLRPDGKVNIIFPNRFHQKNYVEAGVEYRFPSPKDNFIFRIAPPLGKDDLLAVITEEKRKLLEEDYSRFSEPFPTLKNSKGKVLKQVKKGVNAIPSSNWWAADYCSFCVGESCEIEQETGPGDNQYSENQQEPAETGNQTTQETAGVPEKRRALIIGISDYMNESLNYANKEYNFSDLNFPINDATEVKETLSKSFGRIKLITNSQASYENIKRAVTGWLNKTDSEGLALFYFSGHGAFQTDSDGDESDRKDEVLVPYDYPVAKRFIVDDEIKEWLTNLKAKNVVFIADSCHSGTAHKAVRTFYSPSGKKTIDPLEDSIGKDLTEKSLAKSGVGSKESGKTIVALEASKPDQDAKENRSLRHGVFTNFLIEGLKGKADKNGNKKISVKELFDYTHKEVYQFTNKRQEPVCEGCKATKIYLNNLE